LPDDRRNGHHAQPAHRQRNAEWEQQQEGKLSPFAWQASDQHIGNCRLKQLAGLACA
jgi:hypothetical protein